MHLHCTKKLLKQFDLSEADLDPLPPESRLLSWHAHIVFIARSKTFIAVNDQTFYAVIMPRIKKERLERFADEFRSALSLSMKSDGFSDHNLEFLTGEQIHFAKAHNRQVLGIINEVVNDIRFQVERKGRWDRIGIVELTKQINRTPWLAGTRSSVFPVEKMVEDLKSLLH